jgi:monoamine oxidase
MARSPQLARVLAASRQAAKGRPPARSSFAGEHADSFYSYQGFMEGACLSGIRAANEVLADVKAGVI